MGASYANVTVRSAGRAPVVEALTAMRRDAFVADPLGGWVVVLDAAMETDDAGDQAALCEELTRRLRAPGLGAAGGGGAFRWWLVDCGRLVDHWAWTAADGGLPAEHLGRAERLCRTLGSSADAGAVARILAAPGSEAPAHDALANALGLPRPSAGFGHASAHRGDLDGSFPGLAVKRVPQRPRSRPAPAPVARPYRNDFLLAAIRRLLPMLQIEAASRSAFDRAVTAATSPGDLRSALAGLQDAVRGADERAAVRRLIGMLGDGD